MSKKADLVFCMDMSGKNAPEFYITRLIVKKIAEKFNGYELNVRFIEFKNFELDGKDAMKISAYCFPEEKQKFESYLDSVYPTGGDCSREHAAEALVYARRGPWIKDSQKVIVVMSDSAPEKFGYKCAGYPEGMPASKEEFAKIWEKDDNFDPADCMVIFYIVNKDEWKDVIDGIGCKKYVNCD